MKSLILMALVATPVLAFAAERDLTKPINTICPVDGMVVDASRDPIVVSDSTGRHSDLVSIGVCTHASCADTVRKDPETYLDAARRDRIAKRDGARGTSAGSMSATDDDQGTEVRTDSANRGKAADPAERRTMNDRPNALKMQKDFDDLSSGANVRSGDGPTDDEWSKSKDRY